MLLKRHTVYLSCGPFVLRTLLSYIELEQSGRGKQWLGWMRKIELEWVTFPNLRIYPPNRENGKDEWWWEQEENEMSEMDVDVDHVLGTQYNGHYDEYDYEGGYYDDNFYEPEDSALYPSFSQLPDAGTNVDTNTNNPMGPFGLPAHYPFTTLLNEPAYDTSTQEDTTKLQLLVSMEVTPLFAYLSSPLFLLSSITLPLYFVSKQTFHHRETTRPGYALPLKIRYWVQVVVHALLMLGSENHRVDEVKVKYMPWDIWASMDPSDDLLGLVERGVWFKDEAEDDGGGERSRDGEGEAFKAVWHELARRDRRLDLDMLHAEARYVKWEGDLDKWRVGDEVEVLFTRAVEKSRDVERGRYIEG